jgi:hydrogenase maturation factor
LRVGKVPAELLRELLEPGEPLPPEVVLGPRPGEDACAIEVAGGILVAATDPITFTGRGVGGHAVVINANDVAVMGVRPRWFLCAAMLPVGTTVEDVRALFRETREALAKIGAALVGGHTEVTPAVTQPLVVGQFLGYEADGRFVRTGGVVCGDIVLQVGEVPVEGAAVLAAEAADRLGGLEPSLLARARRALEDPGISVVEPALAAARLGAGALHDPTEGGLATALHELAEASGVALVVDEGSVRWFAPGRAVCDALGADPWGTSRRRPTASAIRGTPSPRSPRRWRGTGSRPGTAAEFHGSSPTRSRASSARAEAPQSRRRATQIVSPDA